MNSLKHKLSTSRELVSKLGALKESLENPNIDTSDNKNDLLKQIKVIREDIANLDNSFLNPSDLSVIAKLNASFASKLKSMRRIEFYVGSVFKAREVYVIEIGEGINAYIEQFDHIKAVNMYDFHSNTLYTKTSFLNNMSELFLGEWESLYSSSNYGLNIFDGVQWHLIIEFDGDAKSVEFSGSNAYPYNFSDFLKVIDFDSFTEKK